MGYATNSRIDASQQAPVFERPLVDDGVLAASLADGGSGLARRSVSPNGWTTR
jgi:hypothetical protein